MRHSGTPRAAQERVELRTPDHYIIAMRDVLKLFEKFFFKPAPQEEDDSSYRSGPSAGY